jgi:hypothetical protein
MYAVTIGASGRPGIELFQRFDAVDTIPIKFKLVCSYSVGHHQVGIRMTGGTGSRFVARIYRRGRVNALDNVVSAVAVDAGGYCRVSLSKQLAVVARMVLTQLVSAQVILAHHFNTRVARTA